MEHVGICNLHATRMTMNKKWLQKCVYNGSWKHDCECLEEPDPHTGLRVAGSLLRCHGSICFCTKVDLVVSRSDGFLLSDGIIRYVMTMGN
jgi:hypothetical protein